MNIQSEAQTGIMKKKNFLETVKKKVDESE